MKIDRTTAQKSLPVQTPDAPEMYIFLGVRLKILLSSKDSGGQFSLVEGLMRPTAGFSSREEGMTGARKRYWAVQRIEISNAPYES